MEKKTNKRNQKKKKRKIENIQRNEVSCKPKFIMKFCSSDAQTYIVHTVGFLRASTMLCLLSHPV